MMIGGEDAIVKHLDPIFKTLAPGIDAAPRLPGRDKVPGTAEGLPAIEQLLAEGININVTLLFAIKRYEEVALAYLSGLEKLALTGKPLDRIA